MKKLKFIAFSDIHIHDWKLSYDYTGDRLQDSLEAFRIINRISREKRVPMLFSGDLLHQPRNLTNEVLDGITEVLENLGMPLIGIDGNHDQSKANTHKNISPAYFNSLSKVVNDIICVNYKPHLYIDTMVHGIPYMKHNVGFKTYLKKADINRKKFPQFKHILLIHTDLPGATDDNGQRFTTVENVKLKALKVFDLVLCGHIHIPQVIRKNILMVGAPYQQNIGEMGGERGYWEIYEDLTYKFIPITTIPTYKSYDPKKPPKDFSKHIYVPKVEEVVEAGDEVLTKFDTKLSRKSIAKAYLNVSNQKSKRKRKLLIHLINKIT